MKQRFPYDQIYGLYLSLRPKQRIKNLIIGVPLVFSGSILSTSLFIRTVIVLGTFCLFVGATYIINDYRDRHEDARHPYKKMRPIASGRINHQFALAISLLIIMSVPFFIAYTIHRSVALLFIAYLANTTLYTLYIKRFPIIDVCSIAIGFVIRGIIGIVTIHADRSPWLLIMLFFGALLLGFLKRYQELKHCEQTKTKPRISTQQLNTDVILEFIRILTATIMIAYTLYTFQSTQTHLLLLTVPLVAYAIMRYYYAIFYQQRYNDPIEKIILTDRHLRGTLIIYVIVTIGIVIIGHYISL